MTGDITAFGRLAKFVSCPIFKIRYGACSDTLVGPIALMRALFLSFCMALATVVPGAGVAQDVDPEPAFSPIAAAIAENDWETAYVLAQAQGEVAHTLVTWQRLRLGQGQFEDYGAFFDTHPHWPGINRLRRAGEYRITAGNDPLAVLAYFADQRPDTGQGAVRLAEALIALGNTAKAHEVLVDVWLNEGLDAAGLQSMLTAFPQVLAPHHSARVDEMLWRWRTEDAARLITRLDPDQQALARARIALIDRDRTAATVLAQVSEDLQDDPGLQVDRFNRFAALDSYEDAIAILRARSTSRAALGQPFRWASRRASIVRLLMREGRAPEAYALARAHFLIPEGREGRFFADLEWLAGYISLRYLDDPDRALGHFAALSGAVSGPISTSRAAYWTARAYDALDRPEAATQSYLQAAQHQTAFYGLLASDHLELSLDPALAGREQFADWKTSGFANRDLVQALRLLLDVGDRRSATLFTAHMAATFERQQIGQLGDMLTDLDETYLTVLAGKAAVERGILIPAHYFPLHDVAALDLPVEPALTLSIARRESEFNIGAGSPVGALGMMQLMPGTAREVAGELDLPYSRPRLTSDWRYNAQLGAQYLANLEATFGPSPVMIAAGYNAGPSRPRTWMTQRGDPRRDQIDIVDWIELIPFTETRNYAMRVTESIPIYRARLTGRTGPVQFRALLVGAPPMLRPVARPLVDQDEAPSPLTPPQGDRSPVVFIPAADPTIRTEPRRTPLRPIGRPVGADSQTPRTIVRPIVLDTPAIEPAPTLNLPEDDEATRVERRTPPRPAMRPEPDTVPIPRPTARPNPRN